MGTLTITNETKGINYSFIHETIRLNGDANLSSSNNINNLKLANFTDTILWMN